MILVYVVIGVLLFWAILRLLNWIGQRYINKLDRDIDAIIRKKK